MQNLSFENDEVSNSSIGRQDGKNTRHCRSMWYVLMAEVHLEPNAIAVICLEEWNQ